MKSKSNKYWIYAVSIVLLLAVLYTACREVTPVNRTVENNVELKFVK